MLSDLIAALLAAVLVCVVPGWFWARVLCATGDRAERLAYSIALSMTLVPAVALVPARLFGFGVTLPVAVLSPLIVVGLGIVAYLRFGGAKGDDAPLASLPTALLGLPALAPLGLAVAILLGVALGAAPIQRSLLPVGLLVVLAGVLHLLLGRRGPEVPVEAERYPALRWVLLPTVLLLVLARGYLGPVLYDWPFIRGVDHYSHAVMANEMLSRGEFESYLIYPPGFHTTVAVISRLSGLRPLEVFPVLAPVLLALSALAIYALARRLWGWEYGVAAAGIAGLVFGGTYWYFSDAMYPNLVAAQFLLVLAVAALGGLCARPSVRAGLLLALLGSSVVLYHQVTALYLALLLALVAACFLPYLLARDRRLAFALVSSMALLGLLSTLYVWDTYDLPRVVGTLLGVTEPGSTRDAVDMAIGTQPPYEPDFLVWLVLSQPVAWFGLLGALLLFDLEERAQTPQKLAHLVLLLWTLVLFVGSITSASGFPQRFGRDLGVPLALLAALAFIVLLRSLVPRGMVAVFATSLVVLMSGTLLGLQATRNLQEAANPSVRLSLKPGLTITPEIAAAGEWLRSHNDGGNIMVSPQGNQVPSRMMLAMGDYSALQSYAWENILKNRDLPPSGPEPLLDVLWVMNHPTGERTQDLLEKHDVGYIIFYKYMPDRPIVPYWQLFEAYPDLYRTVFENSDVLIVTRREITS